MTLGNCSNPECEKNLDDADGRHYCSKCRCIITALDDVMDKLIGQYVMNAIDDTIPYKKDR